MRKVTINNKKLHIGYGIRLFYYQSTIRRLIWNYIAFLVHLSIKIDRRLSSKGYRTTKEKNASSFEGLVFIDYFCLISLSSSAHILYLQVLLVSYIYKRTPNHVVVFQSPVIASTARSITADSVTIKLQISGTIASVLKSVYLVH